MTPTDKRAIFDLLKQAAEGGTLGVSREWATKGQLQDMGMNADFVETVANNPTFPFRVDYGDDEVLVSCKGGKFALGPEDGSWGKQISEGEVLKLWEKRK